MSLFLHYMKIRFSHDEAQVMLVITKALFFLILGLRIFFQNIKVGGGKKIKIKITKKIFFYLI